MPTNVVVSELRMTRRQRLKREKRPERRYLPMGGMTLVSSTIKTSTPTTSSSTRSQGVPAMELRCKLRREGSSQKTGSSLTTSRLLMSFATKNSRRIFVNIPRRWTSTATLVSQARISLENSVATAQSGTTLRESQTSYPCQRLRNVGTT